MKANHPSGTLTLQEAARELSAAGIATSPKQIFRQLRQIGWMDGRVPVPEIESAGLLIAMQGTFTYKSSCGGEGVYTRPAITYKGLSMLEDILHAKDKGADAGVFTLEAELAELAEFKPSGGLDLGNGERCVLGF